MSLAIHGTCHPRFETVRGAFADAFEKYREVGAAIAFSLDGELVVDLWAGHVDSDRTGPWQRDTIVNVYSTTKGMTAICAHQLVERGLLDLDAPVADYWPEFAQAGKESIPVRWLLSHQAGLPAVREPLPEKTLYDWDAMVTALAAEPPAWTPGSRNGYHPMTYGFLVGEVIRRISGRSVGQWFREEVAEPLDADFQIGLPEKDEARVADLIGGLVPPKKKAPTDDTPKSAKPVARLKGPMADFMRDMANPTTLIGAAFNNPKIPRGAHNTRAWRAAELPAANGHGTARSLAKIYGNLACGGETNGVRILESKTIEAATREQVQGPDATLGGLEIRYGLGFMLKNQTIPFSPSERSFGHPGAGGSIGMADPDARVGFGYVMNKMKSSLTGGATGFSVIEAFYDALGN